MKRFRKTVILLLCVILSACSGGSTEAETKPKPAQESSTSSNEKYVVPEFADSFFNEELAEGEDGAYIDLSSVADGYVAVRAESESRLKFQVIKDDTYNYDLASDGSVSIFPLQSRDGHYEFRIMENVSDDRYAVLYETSADVTLADEFQPYIRPNDYVHYTRDSQCVKLADSFSAKAGSALDVVDQVYEYVCGSIKYDSDKAMSVQSGYMPDPDETLKSGLGICFDYASLTAAMLRSQGIPTKVIFGYVSPNGVYHAWNMFYTEESGWVTVGFEVAGDDWNRIDLTFSANGADQTFIGDGSNYTDVYEY